MPTNISAQQLIKMTVTTTGRLVSNVTLEAETLSIHGEINGHAMQTQTDVKRLYQLYSYLETLNLEEKIVPPDKTPRGFTKYVLTYKDGHSITLAFNPTESGLKYFELSQKDFLALQDKWLDL